MNQITEAEGSFQIAWTQVQLEWAELRTRWPDAVGDEFARRHWDLYAREVPMFLRAMEDLASVYEETKFTED